MTTSMKSGTPCICGHAKLHHYVHLVGELGVCKADDCQCLKYVSQSLDVPRFKDGTEDIGVVGLARLLAKLEDRKRTCSYCGEPFDPIARERICPECRQDRAIEREEARESRMKK